jgi:multiple sugar transport system permease protein
MTTETPSTRTLITPTGRRGSVQPYRPQSRSRWGSALRHALMIVVVVISLYPVLWMVVSSLRPEGEIFGNPSLILTSFEWENYAHGWTALGTPFGTYLLNSGIIVLGSIVGNLFSCSLAAYAFARLRFRFQRPAFAYMLVTLMLPIHVVIVPQYILWAQLGLNDSFWPLIVPKFLATDAFFIFLMVQFIRGLPKELDEAARIDGAGHGRIFFQILLPLMTPALATTTIFTFIWVWNEPQQLHGADRAALVHRRAIDLVLRRHVRDERRVDHSPRPHLRLRPEVPHQGHCHHGSQIGPASHTQGAS